MCDYKKIIQGIICEFLAMITVINAVSISAFSEEKTFTLCEVLIEASGGVVILEQNAETSVSIGTMSKLMTVLITAECISNGTLSIDDKLKASSYANTMQGAKIWLMPGEEISVDELLKAVIIGNANDAAVVLAEHISETEEQFAELMNKRAAELGMKNTFFTNCNGYYDDNKQVSTAHDISVLCMELVKYDFLYKYFTCWRDFVRDGQTELVNANELVKNYDGIIGFKASYTDASGYCVASASERNGITYISVILGCNDKYSCFSEAKRLMNTGFSEYSIIKPELPKNIPTEIHVKGGLSQSVKIEHCEVRNVVLPNWDKNSVTSKIIMTDYVYAPIKKGQKVGEIQFLRHNKLLFAVDIIASEYIEEINIIKAFDILLKNLLTL